MSELDFKQRAKRHWTSERLEKLTNGKKLLVLPHEAPDLLRVLGILNKDASMSADAVRKFLQINHMLALLQPVLDDLAARFSVVGVADLCCGKSYLSFLLAHYLKVRAARPFVILGVDIRDDLIEKSRRMSRELGFSDQLFFQTKALDGEALSLPDLLATESSVSVPRAHLVVGLHACDTASDLVLATAVKSSCEAFAVAPCCQAELSRKWADAPIAKDFPFYSVFKTPQLRREVAAHQTDAMRFLLTRAHGYKVTATEFVPSEHTNKNRLLIGERKGRFLKDASEEYERLCLALGDQRITLDGLLQIKVGTPY